MMMIIIMMMMMMMMMQLHRWVRFRDIKGEIESTKVSPQDQTISTNYFKDKILKE
jgi:hypothetical protein